MTTPTDALGAARFDIIVDTSTLEASAERAKSRFSTLSQSAQQSFAQMSAAQKRVVDGLLTQIDTVGKTTQEIQFYKAALKGVPSDVIAELAQRMVDANKATQEANASAAALAKTISGASFSDAQLFKVNQALAEIRENAAAANVAPSFNNSALLKANQALAEYQSQLAATREAEAALAQQNAEDNARFKAVAAAGAASQNQAIPQSARGAAASLTAEERAAQAQQLQMIAAANTAREREADAIAKAAAAQRSHITATDADREALSKLLGQLDPTVAALDRLDKMEAQLSAARSKGLISGDDFDLYAAKIQKARDQVGEADKAINHLSITSAGAKRELGVLFGELLQGNFSNLEGTLASLANRSGLLAAAMTPLGAAVTVGVVALGGLAVAAVAGAEDIDRLNKAFYSTGDAAGVGVTGLDAMASQVGASTKDWSDARAAIEKFVADGSTAGAGLGGLARDAVNFAKATGQSIQDTVQQIEAISTAPADTIAKLNEQYHFLTSAQFAQIQALQEQGRTSDAARIAESALGDAMAQRAKDVEDNSGWIVKSAHWVRDEWNSAWDAVKGIGKTAGLADQVAAIESQIARLTKPTVDRAGNLVQANNSSQVAALQQQLQALRQQQFEAGLADTNAASAALANQNSVAAQQRLAQFATPKQALDNQLKKANADRLAALYGVVDPAQRAAIEAEYKEQVEKATEAYNTAIKRQDGGVTNAGENAQVKAFKDSLAQVNDAFKNSQAELDAERKAGSLSEADYYQQSQDLLWKNESDQITAIQAEINRLQQRKAIGAERIKIDQQVASLEAEASKVESDAVTKSNDLATQQQAAINKRTDAYNAFAAALDLSVASQQRQIDAQVASIGMGDREYQQQQALIKIDTDRAQKLQDLAKLKDKPVAAGGLDPDDYQKRYNKINSDFDQMVEQQVAGYNRINSAREDWETGLTKGLKNWLDQTNNVSSEVANDISSLGNNFNDDFLKGLQTGKFKFTDFANSLITDLERIILKENESKIISGLGGSSGISGWLTDLFGGPSTGVATSGADSLVGQGVASDISAFTFSAKGNVFSSPDLSRFSNQIVDKPTFFTTAYARGGNVMGEAGPEAIMPLRRGPDGRLGVAAAAGAGQGYEPPGVVINVQNNVADKADATVNQRQGPNGQTLIDIAVNASRRAVASDIAGGKGDITKALTGRYGLNKGQNL